MKKNIIRFAVAACVVVTISAAASVAIAPADKNRPAANSLPVSMGIVENNTHSDAVMECGVEPYKWEEVTDLPVVEDADPNMVSMGTFTVTHYCPCTYCTDGDGITATGTVATPGRTLAVDPRIIPYGSKVVLKFSDGTTEDYIAEDCGGSVNGKKVDVFMGHHNAAIHAGIRSAEVFLVVE